MGIQRDLFFEDVRRGLSFKEMAAAGNGRAYRKYVLELKRTLRGSEKDLSVLSAGGTVMVVCDRCSAVIETDDVDVLTNLLLCPDCQDYFDKMSDTSKEHAESMALMRKVGCVWVG